MAVVTFFTGVDHVRVVGKVHSFGRVAEYTLPTASLIFTAIATVASELAIRISVIFRPELRSAAGIGERSNDRFQPAAEFGSDAHAR